jgi:hypothetical protein
MWWCTSIIPALERLRQENCEFKACLAFLVRACLKKKKKKKSKVNKTGLAINAD